MRKRLLSGLAVLAAGASALVTEGSLAPASAQFVSPAIAAAAGAAAGPEVTTVQYRRYYGPPRGYYGGRPYYYRGGRYYYGPGYNAGAAAAAGIAGLAAGAMIGGAIASQQRAPTVELDPDWLAYCASKYRSFDPESGTYVGYDGRRYVCQ